MNELQKYTSWEIEKFTDIKDAVKGKEICEAAEIIFKLQGDIEKAQEAQEKKLRCIRQAGVILLPPELGGTTVREPGKRTDIETSPTDLGRLIEEAGISDEAARIWQKVARVPNDKFEVYFVAMGILLGILALAYLTI